METGKLYDSGVAPSDNGLYESSRNAWRCKVPWLPSLSPRLSTVASQVRQGSRLVDVGCDHAKLCVHLVGTGHCKSAIATDIREGPCLRAVASVERASLDHLIQVVKTDGLQGIDLSNVDDVVIAGMGGTTVLHILNSSPEVKQERIRLVMQPQSDLPLVRYHLYREGYLFEEHLASESDKLYHVFCAEYAGGEHPFTFFAIHVGYPSGSTEQHALYRHKLLSRTRVQLEGLSRSIHADPDKKAMLHAILAELAKCTPSEQPAII